MTLTDFMLSHAIFVVLNLLLFILIPVLAIWGIYKLVQYFRAHNQRQQEIYNTLQEIKRALDK
ncbi:MAG: hypothetical protein FH749_13490 [Firmicutes bacterium]|nr:hypothetical protein [Bacillota bacterium]